MTRLTLNPTALTAGGATPTNLTSALAALGSNTGVTFTNSGREVLVVSVGGTATVATSNIPLLIQGQAVSGESSGTLTTSAISLLGPYPSQFNATDGTGAVTVDFSAQTGVTVALVRVPGVV